MDQAVAIAQDRAADPPWRVGRVDLRAPVGDQTWPVARVELIHHQRGRVTDLGTAPTVLDAAFVAASHIIGLTPRTARLDVRSIERDEGALGFIAEVELELDGRRCHGTAEGRDLIECALRAWLAAAYAPRTSTPVRGSERTPDHRSRS